MALLSVAEALERVTKGLTPLETERVALDRASGRVLAEDIAARAHPAAVRCLGNGRLCCPR